jgi:predicted transcriptional regulator
MLQKALSRRERQIMEIIYRLGEATAAQVHEQIADPPSYSPIVSRTRARTAALADVVDNFFEGSAVRAAAALLGSSHGKKLTKAELDELSTLIDSARRQGR